MKKQILLLSLPLALTACTVGPNYVPPQTATPVKWSQEPSTVLPAKTTAQTVAVNEVVLARWWESFNDAVLTDLITQAMTANHDLRIATARLQESRARLLGARGEFWPTVDATGAVQHQRTSANGGMPGAEGGLFQLGFDARWELDVFGGVRRSIEAAQADLQAADAGYQDIMVSLLAEVGRNYIHWRSAEERLAIAQANLKAQNDSLGLVSSRFKAGLTTELDVAQAEALVGTTLSQIPALHKEIQQVQHRLAVLVGKEPLALAQQAMAGGVKEITVNVPMGVPADLMRRRPDIRRAERELAAATARVGVATSDLYPKFILSGMVGLQSVESRDLFDSSSRFYSIGPNIQWRILDFGRINANIAAQDARVQQTLANYEKSVLVALEDVESSLSSLNQEVERRDALRKTMDANRKALSLANDLYQQGLATYLSVLDSERQYHQAQDQLAQSDAIVLLSRIALYKALGGGWEEVVAK